MLKQNWALIQMNYTMEMQMLTLLTTDLFKSIKWKQNR